MSLHLELAEMLDRDLAAQLEQAVERKQDALILHLTNGVTLTVRYAAADAYSLRWVHDGNEGGIDTAPLHRALSTFPNHFHDYMGSVIADPVTDPAQSAKDNVIKLVTALLADPSLGAGAGR